SGLGRACLRPAVRPVRPDLASRSRSRREAVPPLRQPHHLLQPPYARGAHLHLPAGGTGAHAPRPLHGVHFPRVVPLLLRPRLPRTRAGRALAQSRIRVPEIRYRRGHRSGRRRRLVGAASSGGARLTRGVEAMAHPPYVWIDGERDLERAIEHLSKATFLAVDTEADSFYHYHHKCCLIQISDGESVYLVDPLALTSLQPLGEVLGSRVFDPERFWRIKGARDRPPQKAAVLRELYAMRDRRAGAADLSPFRIISDEALLALARKRPAAMFDLNGVRGVTPLVRRRIGTDILQAVQAGLEVPEADRPVPPRGRPRKKSAASQARLERLREWRKARALELGLDPGVLFPQTTRE